MSNSSVELNEIAANIYTTHLIDPLTMQVENMNLKTRLESLAMSVFGPVKEARIINN